MMPVVAPRNDYPGFAFGPQLEEDVPPVDQVVFLGAGEQKELSMVARVVKAAQAAEKPAGSVTKVKVVEPYRVCHEGKAYVGGETLQIPDDDAHKVWLQSGWVKEVK